MDYIKIALHGKKNSGKDTSARIFKKIFKGQYKKNLTQTSFAYPIKKLALQMLGFSSKRECPNLFYNSELRDHKIPGYELTYRDLCKKIGAVGKELDKDFWIKKTKVEFKDIIVSDLRYKNELDFLKNEGFYLIKIFRDNVDKIDLETDLDDYQDWDYIIDNTGSRDNLKKQIANIVHKIIETV